MQNSIVDDKVFEGYVKKYDEFISFFLRKVMKYGINLDRDELRNLMYEQIWYCIKHHDPERSAFQTYLYMRCWGAFLHHLRDISSHYNRFKTNEFIDKEDKPNTIEHDVLCREILEDLPEDDTKESLIMYVMQGHTYREIGEMFGISHVTARSRIRKILAQIRKKHNKETVCH